MELHTLAIPIAFILLAAVLCLLLIGSKWKWWQKLAVIVIVPAFGLVVWAAVGSYKGWPAVEKLPTKSLIYWMLIREPDPKRDDPGAIYVWLKPLDAARGGRNPLEYAGPRDEPRAYRLRYSRKLHLGLQSAQNAIRDGKPVVLDLTDAANRGEQTAGGVASQGANGSPPQNRGADGGDAGAGAGAGGGEGGHGRTPRPRNNEALEGFKIYELPPPHPPSKEPE